ncbi:MAG: carboxyltransferase domain-containing protein, partial [Synergistaceae bacterium]|nr:carboxyltransferase domain-containing protein [Synergistaceae bacterium]
KQTGIYPIDSPGGWQLIGRTPLRLFTPEASRPTLIEAGYEVRFVPVPEEEYKKIEAEVAAGTYKPLITEAK